MKGQNIFKRRDFLVKSISGAAALTIGKSPAVHGYSKPGVNSGSRLLDPIVPFQYYPKLEKEMLSYIRLLREQYGFRRFLLTGPSKEYRYTGFPDPEVFTTMGEQIRHVKRTLDSLDVEIGWWCATTIRIGKGDFQSIVRADGSIANEACCPLDPSYQETFSDYVASVVEIARPFWINFEDDFHLNGGCYCNRHLKSLEQRLGRHLTREELVTERRTETPESEVINRLWDEASRESLADLAAIVRKKVDRLAPETRLCLCESGNSERDGNFTETVARAFAGKTRPAVRVHGSSYFSDQSLDLAKTLFNPLYKRQHLPSDFELIHESDTFPHTRYFMSGTKLKTLLTCVLAYGLDDSLFYATQYLENPVEEKAYCEMFRKSHKRFDTLKKEAKDCEVTGSEIVRKPTIRPDWVNITGRLGIPHTTVNGKVKLVSGSVAATMSDEEIKTLLHSSVFLDGHAAYILSSRGFSRWIGVDVGMRRQTLLPPFYERIHHAEKFNIKNRLVYNYVWAFGDKEKSFYELKPTKGTEVLTDFVGSDEKSGSAGITRFVNEWGGRVAVMAFNVEDAYVNTRAAAMFNYSKQILLQKLIAWLNPEALPVSVNGTPNTFCIFSQSKSGNYGIATITGLSSDTFDSLKLNLSPAWENSEFAVLRDNGDWERITGPKLDGAVEFALQLSIMNPVVIKITKTQ